MPAKDARGIAKDGTDDMKLWGPFSAAGMAVGLLAAAADQAFKVWMIGVFEAGQSGKIVLAPFFDLVMAWNRGISYGLLKQDSDTGRWMLIAVSILAIAGLAYWLAQIQNRLAALSIGLVLGGAAGNVIDRIRFGAVADFFSFHAGSFYWYIFNVADVAIVAGVAGLLFDSLNGSHKSAGKQA
jgi:signal peptidase II